MHKCIGEKFGKFRKEKKGRSDTRTLCIYIPLRDKGRYLTPSYAEIPYSNKKKAATQKCHKTSITQRFQTDFKRPVEVATANQLVGFYRFTVSQLSN